MLIPAIDLMDGKIVQLVQGETKVLEFTDVERWITRFEHYRLVQVVDLNAALRQGSNFELITRLVKRLPCQVGGGIATVELAQQILKAGAHRVIVGSALFRDGEVDKAFAAQLANELGSNHLVFSVDSKRGRIAVRGWKECLALSAPEAMAALEPFCGAFLYTHIDTEGMMAGFPIKVARKVRAATKRQLVIAGGIRSLEEVAALEALGCDAVVGMAIYSGVLSG